MGFGARVSCFTFHNPVLLRVECQPMNPRSIPPTTRPPTSFHVIRNIAPQITHIQRTHPAASRPRIFLGRIWPRCQPLPVFCVLTRDTGHPSLPPVLSWALQDDLYVSGRSYLYRFGILTISHEGGRAYATTGDFCLPLCTEKPQVPTEQIPSPSTADEGWGVSHLPSFCPKQGKRARGQPAEKQARDLDKAQQKQQKQQLNFGITGWVLATPPSSSAA
jgi:hypothetical protein